MKKSFILIFLWLLIFNSLYAADNCSVIVGSSQSPLVAGTPYVKSDSVTNSSKYDDYYFRAPAAGTVTITLTESSDVLFSYGLNSCPSSSGGTSSIYIPLSSDLDFNIKVYRASGSGSKNYTLTVAYSPNLSIVSSSLTEGNSSTSTMNFNVNLSSSTAATVNYSTTDGTATAGSDYTATNGILSFTSGGATTKTISVPIIGDRNMENNETFLVTLTNASGANISTATATGTIIDDDNYNTSNTRDYTLVNGFPYNIKGDIQIIGNSVTLKADTMDCAPVGQNNNGFKIAYADKDSDSATYNSTSADISLPVGTTKIKYAGLYWQGRTQTTTILEQGKTVKIRFPNSSTYQTVSTDSSKFNWFTETGITASSTNKLYSYQGFTDVTSLLQTDINKVSSTTIENTGYSATIWVADVATEVGMTASLNGYGAWSLVVVYEDNSGKLKNISVYDGYRLLKVNNYQTPNLNETLTQTLSGFYTPPSGAVNSKFLFFGGEGDAGDDPAANSGYNDSASLTNKAGTAISLGTDIFNGTETNSSGNNITTRNPACANTIGIDIHTYDIGTSSSTYPIIGNSQTSTILKLTPATNEDSYLPGIFAFATDIYTPALCYVEDIFRGTEKISGQSVQVNADENLTVRVYVKNTGNESAQKVQILHQFDSSFPYVINSTDYNNTNPTYQTVMPPSYTRKVATDVSGDDLFEYNSTSLLSKINLGSGATASSGGTFLDNNKTTAVFEYNATVKTAQNYTNAYKIAYVNSTLGIDYSNNPVQMNSCTGDANSFFGYTYTTPGGIDAVDDYATNGYSIARGLQTKIANKNGYTLDTLWLGTGKTPIAYTGTNPMPIRISLSDNTCTLEENLAQTTGYVEAKIPVGSSYGTSSAFAIVNAARKNAKLRFRYIDWSNLPGGNYSQCLNSSSTLSSLEGVPSCINSDTKLLKAFGQSIATQCGSAGTKPACQSSSYNSGSLPSAPYDNALGCFMCLADALNGATCSADNFAIRPDSFNSTILTNQQFIADANSTISFRANQYSGTGTTDYNESLNGSFKVDVNISDSSKTCAVPSMQFSPAIAFTNGISTSTLYRLPNVGDFNISMYEIPGAEYAIVDADDTADSQRYISPYAQQIKVVPHRFNIDGNFTNGSNGFTYLSNFSAYPNVADRNISARLDLNITAYSATSATLSNYTALCYAKDANLTVKTATVGNTLTGLNKLLWYDALHTLTSSVDINNSSSNYIIPLDNTQFDSATNGMAEVKYLINFDRNNTKVVEPFIFNISDLNTTNEDNRSGTKTLNQSATYYYGRVYSTDYRGISPTIPATIRYEVYCKTCNLTTLGINGTQSPASVMWYQNILHDTLTDGKVSAFVSIGTTNVNPNASTTITDGIEANTLTNNNAPYTDRIQMTSSSWLLYNAFNANATSNNFNVEFIQSGNWAGQGTLGQTVDVNTSTRTNRRMEW